MMKDVSGTEIKRLASLIFLYAQVKKNKSQNWKFDKPETLGENPNKCVTNWLQLQNFLDVIGGVKAHSV